MNSYQYPEVMGKPITREEVIEGLQTAYNDMVTLHQQYDPQLVGFPDMQMIINYIDIHGLPAKEETK